MFHDEFVAEGSSLKSVLDYWVEIHPLSKQDTVSIVLTGTNIELEILINNNQFDALILKIRKLLGHGFRGKAETEDDSLHHHLLFPRRNVRHRVLDQLPRAPGECPRPHDHPRHCLPRPRQHLQQHHQQHPQGGRTHCHRVLRDHLHNICVRSPDR